MCVCARAYTHVLCVSCVCVCVSCVSVCVCVCVCVHAHIHMSWPQLLPTFNHLSKICLFTCKNLHILRPLNSSKFLSPFRAVFHKQKLVVVLLAVVAGGSSFIIFLREELPEDGISIGGWAGSPPSRDPTPRPPASQAGFSSAPESQLGPSGCLTKSCNKEQDVCHCQGSRAGTAKQSSKGSESQSLRFVGYVVSAPATQFCQGSGQWESSHRRYVNKRAWLCSNKTLFTKIAGQLALARGLELAHPGSGSG